MHAAVVYERCGVLALPQLITQIPQSAANHCWAGECMHETKSVLILHQGCTKRPLFCQVSKHMWDDRLYLDGRWQFPNLFCCLLQTHVKLLRT